MAEYIKREDALAAVRDNEGDDIAIDILLIPAADVAEVVRCRECRYACNPGENIVLCDIFERDMMPDDFCSLAERKEADHGVSEP